jgi:His/Glu/Gln/Arg/opine family amino acid ABC transporter permease subunit
MSFDPQLLAENLPALWNGVIETIWLFLLVMLICTPVSMLIALARISQIGWMRRAATIYVNVVRSLPVLVILFFTFYGLPAFNLRVSPFVAAMIGLCVGTVAYLAEDMRGALLAVDHGQYQAADALGIGYWRRTLRLIIPQALPVLVAPYFTRAMVTLKATSLASIVAVSELTSDSMALVTETYHATEFLAFAAVAYLLLSSVLALAQSFVQRKVNLP